MTQPELTRLLHEVGAVPAPAADYGATVRSAVARRRLARTGALVAAGLVAIGALAATAVALSGGDDAVVAAASPSPSVDPAPSESPTPSPEPTPTPTPEPTPTPQVVPTSPAPVPATAAPVRTTARPTSAAPRPTTAPPRPFAARGLSVTLSAPRSVPDGSAVAFSVSVRDNDGRVLSATLDFGDGTTERVPLGASCGARSGTAPEPLSVSTTRSHRYLGPGSYTAVLRVTTGSSCRSTPRETDSDTQTVDVT